MKRIILVLTSLFLVSAVIWGEPMDLPDLVKAAFEKAKLPLSKEKRDPTDFTLPSLDGQNITLSSLKGKIVFLNFWATWCPPCRAEMPSMEALYKKMRDKGFEMLAVDIMEKTDEVKRFVQKNPLSFPVLLDSKGAVSGKYGIQGVPATYILDRDGKIILSVVGSRDWNLAAINSAFEVLLKNGQ